MRGRDRVVARWVVRVLNALPIAVGGALLVVLTLAVGANVIARYVFNSSLFWADEVARFALIWITFLGAAALVRLDEHITVEVFVARLPRGLQTATRALTDVLVAAIGLLLVWAGIDQVERQWGQVSPALDLHMGLVYTVIPIAGVYLFVYAVGRLATVCRATRHGHEPTEI